MSEQDDKDCSICLLEFTTPYITQCKHTFCKECLESWYKLHNTCPMCRAVIQPDEEFIVEHLRLRVEDHWLLELELRRRRRLEQERLQIEYDWLLEQERRLEPVRRLEREQREQREREQREQRELARKLERFIENHPQKFLEFKLKVEKFRHDQKNEKERELFRLKREQELGNDLRPRRYKRSFLHVEYLERKQDEKNKKELETFRQERIQASELKQAHELELALKREHEPEKFREWEYAWNRVLHNDIPDQYYYYF